MAARTDKRIVAMAGKLPITGTQEAVFSRLQAPSLLLKISSMIVVAEVKIFGVVDSSTMDVTLGWAGSY